MLRMLLLVLPQGWVVYTALRFHKTVLGTLETAVTTPQVDLLTDAIVVLAIGWSVLVADLLIAAVLLEVAVWAGARATARKSKTARAGARWDHRYVPDPGNASWPSASVLSPFGSPSPRDTARMMVPPRGQAGASPRTPPDRGR